MPIIYTYPVKSTANDNDLILISDSQDSNKTKQIKIGDLPGGSGSGVSSVTATLPVVSSGGNTPVISLKDLTGFGTAGQVIKVNSGADGLEWGTAGGSTSPASPTNSVQFNNAGAFGGSANLTFTTNTLTVEHTAVIKGQGTGNPSGKLKLNCEENTHALTLEGPAHSGGADYTLKFPSAAPGNTQILQSNNAGQLSWIATPTGGGGSSYQAGNGIDINTGTSPDTISTGLLTNGGLVFSTNKMQVDLAATAMSGELRPVDGGTGLSSYAAGELLYAEATDTLAGLTISTNDKILGINNGATAPQWITNLVGQEVVSGHMLIGNGTSALTQLDTTAKGTIAVGNGTTTTTLAVGTDNYYLKARSGTSEGMEWAAITYPTVSLTSGVTGTLPVANGGTGLASVSASAIPRGSGTSAMVADSYLIYNSSTYSLGIRGSGNNAPSLSCTLAINDAQGPSGKDACIGLTPTGAQGAKAMHVDLGAYTTGIQVSRNNGLGSNAMLFLQTVSGSTQVGSITMSNTATAFNTSSDYRLKENIVEMTGSVDRVKQLLPKRFNFTNDTENTVDGFLAHEAAAIVPESVTGSKDEVDTNGDAVYQGIDQSKLVPLLVGAIKELTARIEALEA